MIRVAIVEDNRQIREGLRFLIDTTTGYRVTGAFGSIEEARPAIAAGDPQVVLMDIGLPGMSGVDGIRLLKTAHPHWHFLVLSVYDDDHRVFDAICAGADGVEHAMVVVVDGEDEEVPVGMGGLEEADAIDAGHAGEPDVHEHHLRVACGDGRARFLDRSERPGDAIAGGGIDEEAQPFADLAVVFDDGDSDQGINQPIAPLPPVPRAPL